MSAIAALEAARAAGVRLKVEGDDLVLEASAAPPSAVLDLLSRYKPGIATILRPGLGGWSTEDWHAFFAERAGIAEFDGALPRPQAEELAFTCCVVEWLNRSAVSSMPGRCIGCGGIQNAHDPLLPFARCKTDPLWPKPVLGGGTAARERSGGVCAICRGDSGEVRRCGSALSAEPPPRGAVAPIPAWQRRTFR